MLTEVINFEIVIPKLNFKGTYTAPNEPDVIDLILRHKFTRSITKTQEFTLKPFEFNLPVSFYDIEDDIDEIDQMH